MRPQPNPASPGVSMQMAGGGMGLAIPLFEAMVCSS
jgi:hypothetical protein